MENDPLNIIHGLAERYSITLISAEDNARDNGPWPNNMSSAGDYIFLNEFDDPDLMLVAFFHELGHVVSGRTTTVPCFCKMQQESEAWSRGLELAAEEGYQWDYDSKQMDYARECLLSYVDYGSQDFGGFR